MNKKTSVREPLDGVEIFIECRGQPVVDGMVIENSKGRPTDVSQERVNLPNKGPQACLEPDFALGSGRKDCEKKTANPKKYELRVSRVREIIGRWRTPDWVKSDV